MSLHWLPIEQRIEFKLLLFTYKALHDTAPSYIKDMLEPYVPHRHLRSAKKMLLREPAYNLHSYGHRSFSVSAPRLWNALPFELKCSPSVNSLKMVLKLSFSKRRFFRLALYQFQLYISFSFILVLAMLFIFSVIFRMVIQA